MRIKRDVVEGNMENDNDLLKISKHKQEGATNR